MLAKLLKALSSKPIESANVIRRKDAVRQQDESGKEIQKVHNPDIFAKGYGVVSPTKPGNIK